MRAKECKHKDNGEILTSFSTSEQYILIPNMFPYIDESFEAIQKGHRQVLREFNAFWNRIVPPHAHVPLDAPVNLNHPRRYANLFRSLRRSRQPRRLEQADQHNLTDREQRFARRIEQLRVQGQLNASFRHRITKLVTKRQQLAKRAQQVHNHLEQQERKDRSDDDILPLTRAVITEKSSDTQASTVTHDQRQQCPQKTSIEPVKPLSVLKRLPQHANIRKLSQQYKQEAASTAALPAAGCNRRRASYQSPLIAEERLPPQQTQTAPAMPAGSGRFDRRYSNVALNTDEILARITAEDERIAALERRMNIAKRKTEELLSGYEAVYEEKERSTEKFESSSIPALTTVTTATEIPTSALIASASPTVASMTSATASTTASIGTPSHFLFLKMKMKQMARELPSISLREAKHIIGPDGQSKINPYWVEIYGSRKYDYRS